MATPNNNLAKEILVEVVLCLNYKWKQHPNYQKEGQCDICFEESMVNTYVLELPCGHAYHCACIMPTVAGYNYIKCPTCAKPFTKNNVEPVNEPTPIPDPIFVSQTDTDYDFVYY